MKILIVVDKQGTAIWRLANSVKRTLSQHDIIIFPIHPKRNDVDSLIEVQKLMVWCDILDIHYWKSGQILRTSFPTEFNSKPKILFHFNPYDVNTEENQYYDRVIVGNNEMYTKLPSAHLIPYGIDLGFFRFNDNYTEEKIVNMSVARIEGKKGVLEVAKVCKELGYKFKLVGRVSKGSYMKEVMEAGKGVIEFWENATDFKLREIYYSSTIHICNSVSGFESGCYDDKTEILTDSGWKLFKDLDKTEKVATLNSNNGYLEYQKPEKYITQSNHKKLYKVNNRAISFAVTGNHNMWVSPAINIKDKKKGWGDYKFIRADNLPSNFKIKRTAKWKGNRYKEYDKDWFRFLGIWLSEGSVYRQSKNSCRISIAGVKKNIRDDIRGLLTRMGITFRETKDQFIFSEQQTKGYKYKWGVYLEQFGKAKDKFVPKEVLNAKTINIEEFINWYVKGDGRIYNGARIIYTSSKKMADGLQECFIKIGNHSNIKVRDNRGKKRWIKDHEAVVNEKEYIIYERVKKIGKLY